jgi:tetratricopeptide (TPR) repeat protein
MAPAYGLPYAEFLQRRGEFLRLQTVAEGMLRVAPGNVNVLRLLAQARLNQGDWAGAQAVADELRARGAPAVESEQIVGAVAAARSNFDESISAFRRAAEAAPADERPMVSLVRTYVAAGKANEALAFLDSVLAASPDNASARLLKGQVLMAKGDLGAAGNEFEGVIATTPATATAYLGLATARARGGDLSAADAVLVQGLQAVPGDFALEMTRAGVLEAAGQFDAAVTLYERLITERPNADLVANNLASLLSDHRSDAQSLARALELAERFRSSNVPQFLDTLGWAKYRNGKAEEAAALLNAAAKQLDLPVFRYHLGMSYLAMGRKDEGRAELERALTLAKGGAFPEAAKVQEALGTL